MESFHADTDAKEVLEELGRNAKDKTCNLDLITGTSAGGLGAAVAVHLASVGAAHLILAARTESKVESVIDQIRAAGPTTKTTFVYLDLLDNATVREAVTKIKSATGHIDALVNNAGVMATRRYHVSKDGVESQLAANYLGHFLLTNLLLKGGLLDGTSLIVNVGSLGYQLGEIRFDDPNFENDKSYNGWVAYGQAKTANLLHGFALGNRLKELGIPVIVVHPGVIVETQLLENSAIDQEYFGEAYALAMERHKGNLPPQTTKPMDVGAATVLAALLDISTRSDAPLFLVENKKEQPWEYACSKDNQEKLWALSERLVGEQFSF